MKKLSVIGSRTFPVTKAEWDTLSKSAQAKVERRGRQIVEIYTLRCLRPGDVVVSGKARGPDSWSVDAAKRVGHRPEEYPADWNQGKGAGFARNTTIAEKGDAVLAFWDGVSRGTLDTITKAQAMGKPIAVVFGDGRVKMNEAWSASGWSRELV